MKKHFFLINYYGTIFTVFIQLLYVILFHTSNSHLWEILNCSEIVKALVNSNISVINIYSVGTFLNFIWMLLSEKIELKKEQKKLVYLSMFVILLVFFTEFLTMSNSVDILTDSFSNREMYPVLIKTRVLELPFDLRFLTIPVSAFLLYRQSRKVKDKTKLWNSSVFIKELIVFIIIFFAFSFVAYSTQTTRITL